MTISSAWLLDVGLDVMVAVGEQELQHLVDSPQFMSVPSQPDHCKKNFEWQGETLSVIDISIWLKEDRIFPQTLIRPLVGVFSYQDLSDEISNTGAISLASIPQRIQVNDTQACALPEELNCWKDIAISCFTHEGNAVPIMGLSSLFSLADPKNSMREITSEKLTEGVSGF